MEAVNRISATHTCLHLRPNNCCGSFSLAGSGLSIPNVLECTFISKDRISHACPKPVAFPSELDHKNVDHKPDLIADKAWSETSDQFLARLQSSRVSRTMNGLKLDLLSCMRKAKTLIRDY